MWFWIGLIIGVGLLVLVTLATKKNIRIKWYDWIIGLGVIALAVITLQHYVGSMNGGESEAATLGALVFGLPAIILAAVEWQLIARRKKV